MARVGAHRVRRRSPPVKRHDRPARPHRRRGGGARPAERRRSPTGSWRVADGDTMHRRPDDRAMPGAARDGSPGRCGEGHKQVRREGDDQRRDADRRRPPDPCRAWPRAARNRAGERGACAWTGTGPRVADRPVDAGIIEILAGQTIGGRPGLAGPDPDLASRNHVSGGAITIAPVRPRGAPPAARQRPDRPRLHPSPRRQDGALGRNGTMPWPPGSPPDRA